MKKAKLILRIIGINAFMAVKRKYNDSVGANDFYKMLQRRLKYKDYKELAHFLRHELHYHWKECAQYQ